MEVQLVLLHWIYLLFIFVIMAVMIMRKDTSLVAILGIFLLAFFATHSLPHSILGIFNSFLYAIKELLGTILVISIIVSMSKVLEHSGTNEMMIAPIARFIRSPKLAYWIIGIVMMVISWFFWPSPAVALIGAILLPVALRVGLPALGAAMAMNLFGHGIALSGDFIIQGAPTLTAKAAGIPVGDVVAASLPLVFIMGAVTTITAYFLLQRDMQKGVLVSSQDFEEQTARSDIPKSSKWMAVIVPLVFLFDVIAMFLLQLQGGDATALVGGTAIFILLLSSILYHKEKPMEKITEYLIHGFQFGFKVFGPVIPIAAFFYLGDSGFTAIFGEQALPQGSHGLVNDLGIALAGNVPLNETIAAFTLTIVGGITGLDGSGFSGIVLAGVLAKLFSIVIDGGVATLTALGQIAAIWVGGGTLVPWALIPAAAICNVDPFELARRNLLPVFIGLFVTTIIAIFLI